ncbi:hypothetical protein [Salininema proteolyticum]|uniref:Uncharacterized protein n=1 Tax=Salininema proteolyticum TaxID=1607685 RepID=A0ABV8TVG8_9ACTN
MVSGDSGLPYERLCTSMTPDPDGAYDSDLRECGGTGMEACRNPDGE